MAELVPNRFPAAVAYDTNTGNAIRNAEADVYDITDTSFSSPLPLLDLAGVPMSKLVSSNDGIYPPFIIDSDTEYAEAIAKSGSFYTPLVSQYGLRGPQGEPGAPGTGFPDAADIPEGYMPIVTGGEWTPAAPPASARQIEPGFSATHVQWRYVGDATWTDWFPKTYIQGEPGTNGTNGTNGAAGESVQMRQSGDYFQFKYPSQTLWTNLAYTLPAGSVIQVNWNGSAWGDRPTGRTDVFVRWVGGPVGNIPASAINGDVHEPDAD